MVRSENLPQEEVTVMKHLFLRTGLMVLLACGLIAACASPAVAQDAAATYKTKCAMCHQPDGKGGKMGTRDFASPEVQKETDAELTTIITKGKGKIPAYETTLKDTEIKDRIAYVRSLATRSHKHEGGPAGRLTMACFSWIGGRRYVHANTT